MEEKGLQEDPRYSQLLALRARQGNMDPNQRPSSMPVSSPSVFNKFLLPYRLLLIKLILFILGKLSSATSR